jgi:hypothetical protein
MKKSISNILFALTLPAMILGCDSDDDDFSATADFAGVGSSAVETDGTITIPFRNASSVSASDITIGGDAEEGTDYTIVGVTSEGVEIQVLDENEPEERETIRLMFNGSNGNAVHTVNLLSEDEGKFDIDLTWPSGIAAADMDLLLWWYDEEHETWVAVAQSWGSTFEHLRLDWRNNVDGTYGLTYNYYAGTPDPLDFKVTFTPTINTLINEGTAPLEFNVRYTGANEDDSGDYHIVQTFEKSGYRFSDFSDVEVPASGSRTKAELIVKLKNAASAKYAGN